MRVRHGGLTRVKTKSNYMSIEQPQEKEYYYRGMPVRNAVRPLYMELSKADVENGKPQDPGRCAFALCLKRNLSVPYAEVHRTFAFVESIENGRSVLNYYIVKGRTKSYLEIFDVGDILDEQGNIKVPMFFFKLSVPSPSQSIGYKAPPKPIPYANPKEASNIKSEVRVGPIPPPKPTSIKKSLLRNSTGKVRFDRY
jgi:hypothetical protein